MWYAQQQQAAAWPGAGWPRPAALPPGYDPAEQLMRYNMMQQQLLQEAARHRQLSPLRSRSFSEPPQARAFQTYNQPAPGQHLVYYPGAPSVHQGMPGHPLFQGHPQAGAYGMAPPWPSLAALGGLAAPVAAGPPPLPPQPYTQLPPPLAENRLRLSARTLPESNEGRDRYRRERRRARRHRRRRSSPDGISAVQLLAGVIQQLVVQDEPRGRRQHRRSSSESTGSSSASDSGSAQLVRESVHSKHGGEDVRRGKAARRLQRWWRTKIWQSRDEAFRGAQRRVREERNVLIFMLDFVHDTLRSTLLPEVARQTIVEVSVEEERVRQYNELLEGILDDIFSECLPQELRKAANAAINELVNSYFYQKLTAVKTPEESYTEEFVGESMSYILSTIAREAIIEMAEKHMEKEWVEFLTQEFVEPMLFKLAREAYQETIIESIAEETIEEGIQQECRSISFEV
eukprot:tig00020610_g11983.t1